MTARTCEPILDIVRLSLAFVACLAGCLSKPTFECAGDAQCSQNGAQGTCQPDNRCSFPDPACASGQRYGDLSGTLANQCVGVDILPDADPVCLGGSGAYELCITPPGDAIMLTGTLDTATDPRCAPPTAAWLAAGQPDACVIAGNLTVAGLAVTGAKPLVLLGDTIAIDGTLDVASHRGGASGPGAPFAGCAPFVAGPDNDVQGASGGAGASWKTRGGNGGDGDSPGNDGGIPAMALAEDPAVLRAGCAGQRGGTGQAPAGVAGQGGGGVFLAATTITFGAAGVINASGAGGAGGGNLSGGSGGGSGGMIVLHATTITGAAGARLIANGGGGASGGSPFGNTPSGADPDPASPTMPAAGGSGSSGGVGGNGFAGVTQAQAGQPNNNRGGGGGGGGGGFIQSNVALANITSSPAATIVP